MEQQTPQQDSQQLSVGVTPATDVFLSYARVDRPRVEPLVTWLEDAGFRVWWDRQIEPGHAFDATIEAQLAQASAVVVVWSKESIQSQWVQAEANEGFERSTLIPVHIDQVRPPMPFRHIQGVELHGFPRRLDGAALSRIEDRVAALVQRSPRAHQRPAPWRQRLTIAVTAVTLLAGALTAWWNRPAVDPASADSFYFETFSAVRRDDIAMLESLGEEVAAQLTRAAGLTVTQSDTRSIPNGALVRGRADAQALTVTVAAAQDGGALFQQTYSLADGLSTVQNQVANDLAELAGSPAVATTFVAADAYRDYLQAAALLRQSPTNGRLQQARSAFETIVTAHPTFARAYARLCETHLKLYADAADPASFSAAEASCHRAMTLDDGDLEVFLALAELYLTAGQQNKALDTLQRATSLQPRSATIARSMGRVYEALGEDEQALQAYERALRIEPGYWENYNELGAFYYNKALYSQAAEYFGKEADLVRDKALSLNNVASSLFMQGDQLGAVSAWHESVRQEPTINALLNLGSAAFFEQTFDEATGYYQRAAALAPSDQRVAGHLADALRAAQKPDALSAYQAATKLAKQALRVDPGDTETRGDLAAYQAALGNRDQALQELERLGATANTANNVNLAYDRALVFARLNQVPELQAAIDRLIALGYPQQMIEQDYNLQPERPSQEDPMGTARGKAQQNSAHRVAGIEVKR